MLSCLIVFDFASNMERYFLATWHMDDFTHWTKLGPQFAKIFMKVFALTPAVSSSTYAASAERRIQNHFVIAFHALCLEEEPTSKNVLKKSSFHPCQTAWF